MFTPPACHRAGWSGALMVTPECPVLCGRGALASLACPDMSCIVWSLEQRFILGAGAILWVLGISGAKTVGRGYSAGVKRYVQGGADREWRVRLGQGRWRSWGAGGGSEVRETRDKKSMCVYYKNSPLGKV